jgi:deoxyribodipyrimidine photo-lyase
MHPAPERSSPARRAGARPTLQRHLDRALVWFRRDLRATDHAALYHALAQTRQVWCVFVFDTDILATQPSRRSRRVEFIRQSLVELDAALRERGGGLLIAHGHASVEICALAAELQVQAVFANRDYEPAAVARDQDIGRLLEASGIRFELLKDQVIFERDEIMTGGGTPYSVFTPYKNAWLKALTPQHLQPWPVDKVIDALARPARAADIPSLEALGFEKTNLLDMPVRPGQGGAEELLADFQKRIDNYDRARDFPAVKGPSYLSVHLRFGTVSIRRLAALAHKRQSSGQSSGAAIWLSELIWREFYFQILHHHPRVVGHAFKPEFEVVQFGNDKALFAAWCEGRTGYPLVDAAMRQLNQSGYMHNRLRMVAASFLVKDLHVDWRWGERYFAEHLNDFDLAANNGGWQWAASTGCDAQPYFRIFNPVTQSEKFDAEGKFIRRYVPELAKVPAKRIHAPWTMGPIEQQASGCVIGRDYPEPVVDPRPRPQDHAGTIRRRTRYCRTLIGSDRRAPERAARPQAPCRPETPRRDRHPDGCRPARPPRNRGGSGRRRPGCGRWPVRGCTGCRLHERSSS